MLRQWTIGNFKSFSGSTTLPLAPITILAGANSSGKSSIIQSILLVKQTLQYAPIQRPVGLNGPLLKLGRFDDVKNADSTDKDIALGWVLDELQSYRASTGLAGSRYLYGGSEDSPASVTFSLSIGVVDNEAKPGNEPTPKSAELLQLQPALISVSCDINVGEGKSNRSASVTLTRKSGPPKQSDGFLDKYEAGFPFNVRHIDQETRNAVTGQRPDNKIIGADVRHFMPFRFGFSYNQRKFFSQKVADYLVSPNAHVRYSEPEISDYDLPKEVIDFLIEHITSASQSQSDFLVGPSRGPSFEHIANRALDQGMTAAEFVDRIERISRQGSIHGRARQAMRTSLAERQEELQTLLFKHASTLSERGFETGLSRPILIAADQMQAFFQGSIHYLGPLRDEPRPIYPLVVST